MSEHEIDVSLQRARQQLRAGNPEAAIETLRRVLSLAPEHAYAHALLAWVLIDRRRLHAAELEAGHALLEDPELPMAHFVMAQVAMARRELDRARTHLDQLLELEPHDAENHALMASYHELRGQWDEARASLDHALSLAPEDPDVLVALGQLHYQLGRIEPAAGCCQQALELDPEHLGAHRLRGWLDLHAGNVEEARRHACFVLAHDPADEPALTLLVAIMARRSIWLGSWWRLSTWLGQLEDQRRMVVLLGSFVVYRVLTVVAHGVGHPELAEALQWAWLGVCAYTWVAPLVFQRLLARELGQVRLRDDY